MILAWDIWLLALRYPEKECTCCVCVAESLGSLYVIAPEAQRPHWAEDRPVRPEEVADWMRSTLTAFYPS
jgi:hypothetical protein